MALNDNIQKYEKTFGTIERKAPRNGNNSSGLPNPFQA